LSWIKERMLEEENNITEADLDMFIMVDTSEEAVDFIKAFCSRYLLSPNF
jgi:hypothetical protein